MTNKNVIPAERQMLDRRYSNACATLLSVVVLTLLNIILLVAGNGTFFLYSAFLPYVVVTLGMFWSGRMPVEFIGEEEALSPLVVPSLFWIAIAVAAVIILLYLLAWIFARKRKIGWLIFGLIFFSLDTAFMLLFSSIQLDNILDIIFHGAIIVTLIIGVVAYYKAKKLPPEEPISLDVPVGTDGTGTTEEQGGNENAENGAVGERAEIMPDSPILRIADTEVKARTLLEVEVDGHKITYRRVKRVNELVIDGKVYAEYEALVEHSHALSAQFCGHIIEVGLDTAQSQSFARIDGRVVSKKARLL